MSSQQIIDYVECIAREGGDVQDVLSYLSLSRHRTDIDVQVACLEALGTMCENNDDNRRRVGDCQGMEVIVEGMKLHSASEVLQQKSCNVLLELCKIDINRRISARIGVVEIVLDIIRSHKSDCYGATYACLVLCRLSLDEEGRRLIGDSDGIGLLCNIIGDACTSEFLKGTTCMTLGCVCLDNPKNKRAAGIMDAIGVLSNAMKNHYASEDVQRHACETLAFLCSDHTNKTLARNAGAISITIAAMNIHKTSTEVQIHGCYALGRICKDHSSNKSSVVVKENAIPTIVKAMRSNMSSETLQQRGCMALLCMCDGNDDNKRAARRCGALSIIKRIKRKYESSSIDTSDLHKLLLTDKRQRSPLRKLLCMSS